MDGIGYGVAGVATSAALAGGIATTCAANPNAGVHEYALAMGLGAINPIGGAVGLAGGGIGYGVDRPLGGDGRTGYLLGDFTGSLLGMGVADVARVTAKGGALGHATWHAAKQVGVTGAFAGGGFAGGYWPQAAT